MGIHIKVYTLILGLNCFVKIFIIIFIVLDNNQSIRNKITFSTTLGLVVHAAGILFIYLKKFNRNAANFKIYLKNKLIIKADGIALGAAAATSKTDVEMIVFFAIMLHKVRI